MVLSIGRTEVTVVPSFIRFMETLSKIAFDLRREMVSDISPRQPDYRAPLD